MSYRVKCMMSVYKLNKRIHVISCKRQNNSCHTVFQLYPNSPHITAQDVKKAMQVTKRMKPYQRLQYFHERGMHYSRCVKYINVIEHFQKVFELHVDTIDTIDTIDTHDSSVSIYEYEDDKPMSIQDIGAIIDELLKNIEDN